MPPFRDILIIILFLLAYKKRKEKKPSLHQESLISISMEQRSNILSQWTIKYTKMALKIINRNKIKKGSISLNINLKSFDTDIAKDKNSIDVTKL